MIVVVRKNFLFSIAIFSCCSMPFVKTRLRGYKKDLEKKGRKTLVREDAECGDVGERERERERNVDEFFSVILSFSRGRR